MNIYMLGNIFDMQTGMYIMESFTEHCSNVVATDVRKMISENSREKTQQLVKEELDTLGFSPDIILVLKGLELNIDTLDYIKEKYPKAKLVNWFFDKYLLDKPIWEDEKMFEFIKIFDYFFCSLKGVADKLQEVGITNAVYLDEACHPDAHGEVYVNHFQSEKYGSDITFIGSLGLELQHSTRLEILKRVVDEGFRTKIWGVNVNPAIIPPQIREVYQGNPLINIDHSKAVQSSIINIGIDQDATVDMGHSARVYRVMCAGGCYVSEATKGLDKMFKSNKLGEMPDGSEEIVLFNDLNDMVELIDFLLENDEIARQIGLNGQKKVLAEHTFVDRTKEMIEIIKKGEKK